VDCTHPLKLELEQQYRAMQRVAEMLNKFGDLPCLANSDK
jgi:hypothetical protein